MLFVIYNVAVFLFLTASSISLAGIKFRKKALIFLFSFSFISLLIAGTIYLLGGTGLTNIFYPVYLHGALFLLMAVFFEIPLSLSFAAVMSANMLSKIPMFFGALVKHFSAGDFLYYLTILIVAAPILVALIKYYAEYISMFFRETKKHIYTFCIIPVLFSVFYYLTGIFPKLLNNITYLVIECMPLLVMIVYFYFIIIFSKEMTSEKKRLGALTREAIQALSYAAEINDFYTNGHAQRVAEYSLEIAKRLKLSEFEVTEIYYAGLLHDVGKIGVDNNIINKNGKLTDVEYQVLKNHPKMGFRMLDEMSKNTEFKNLAVGALSHHERIDGKGYPDGVKGDQIPLAAKIIAVADAYDAMTSNRSYRETMPQDIVRKEIMEGLGTQFDERIGKIMIEMIDEDKNYKMRQEPEEMLEVIEDAEELK